MKDIWVPILSSAIGCAVLSGFWLSRPTVSAVEWLERGMSIAGATRGAETWTVGGMNAAEFKLEHRPERLYWQSEAAMCDANDTYRHYGMVARYASMDDGRLVTIIVCR